MFAGFTAVIANLPLSSRWFQIDEASLSYRGRGGHHRLPVSRICGFLYINGGNCEFLFPQHVQRWSSVFTFVSTLVRKQQTAVLTFCLELGEPLFDSGQAEVLFEEGVAGEGRKERSVLSCVRFAWSIDGETHPPITRVWSSILKCFTASCRQATAPRRP